MNLLPLGPVFAAAQAPSRELGLEGMASRPVTMVVMLALLSLAPFAMLVLTSFSKMAVVFSLMRTAMGAQQAPPSIVLTGLAVVLSGYVMAPVVQEMVERGRAVDLSSEPAHLLKSSARIAEPLREFLVKHGDPAQRGQLVELAMELRPPETAPLAESDLAVVIPAFVLTELKEAFQLGFLVFLPFLVIDMVVANVLLALGMQTLSPTQVSLAFKVLLFVAVDGWSLLARGLMLGYR